MKKKLMHFSRKFGGFIAAFAMVVSVTAANRACLVLLHQPELPERVKSLRRF